MNAQETSICVVDGQSFPARGLVDMARATYQNTPLVVTEIRPQVFTLIGAGGTVTAIGGSRGCAVIDTGYGPRVAEIRNAIESAAQQSPRWLVNTHWHFDHTDGNSVFAETGATVVAHTNTRVRLSSDQFVPSLEWRIAAMPRTGWPALTFSTPIAIDLGSHSLELIAQAPAHTDGDVAVWLPGKNVLVMGDLMTNGSYPIIDESSHGSLRGMILAVERLLRVINSETVVVPGHGPVADRDSLVKFHEMLRTIEGRIQPQVGSGKSFDEILASRPTADFDGVWGRGYVTGDIFVRMILAGFGLVERLQAHPPDDSGSRLLN